MMLRNWATWDASYTVPSGVFRADVMWYLGCSNVGSALSLALQSQGPWAVLVQCFAQGSQGERLWALPMSASVCKESQNVAWRWDTSPVGGGCCVCREANRHLHAKGYSFPRALDTLGTKWCIFSLLLAKEPKASVRHSLG